MDDNYDSKFAKTLEGYIIKHKCVFGNANEETNKWLIKKSDTEGRLNEEQINRFAKAMLDFETSPIVKHMAENRPILINRYGFYWRCFYNVIKK